MKLLIKLQNLPDQLHMQRPKMQEILDALEDDAVALTLVVLSLPAIIPTPGVPAGLLFGSVLIFIGLQMSFSLQPIRIPLGLSGLQIDRSTLKRIIDRALPYLEKLEKWIRPRLFRFITPRATRVIGLIVTIMGLLIALPIPFGNTLPGLAVLFLAIGLGQKDGVTILVGIGLAVISCATSWGLLAGGWWLIREYLIV